MERPLAWVGGIITIVSIITSVVVSITTDVEAQVAIVLGLTTTLLTLGFTAFVVLRDQLLALDRRRIGALPLQHLLSMPAVEPTIVRIVEQTARVQSAHSPFMMSLARQALDEVAVELTSIADGVVLCESRDELALVKRALAQTERRVRAIAARGADWWLTAEADVYWRLYETASRRLEITRIFLVDDPADEQLLVSVIARHRRAGLSIYVLARDRVPPALATPTVIFDESLVHRAAPTQRGDGLHFAFSDRDDEILAAEAAFDTVLQLAREAADDEFADRGALA